MILVAYRMAAGRPNWLTCTGNKSTSEWPSSGLKMPHPYAFRYTGSRLTRAGEQCGGKEEAQRPICCGAGQVNVVLVQRLAVAASGLLSPLLVRIPDALAKQAVEVGGRNGRRRRKTP